mmetsp:Transcript_12637/g.29853  ORF Transcript_12637/g.29853 Transcript_12637/m.29853 type:complete len:868 (-) Transcript_12637:55-2658(-)
MNGPAAPLAAELFGNSSSLLLRQEETIDGWDSSVLGGRHVQLRGTLVSRHGHDVGPGTRSLDQQKGGALVVESGNFLFTIVATIILAPCILAGVAQAIYCYKKSVRAREERKIDAVSNNPGSRLLVLNELFKNSSKLVTKNDASPKKKRVQVKKRRKKTPEERQASRDALDDQLQNEDASTDSWWGEEEVKSSDGLDDQPAFIIITRSRDDGNDLMDRGETISTHFEGGSLDKLSEARLGESTVERKQKVESANDIDSPNVKVTGSESTELAIEPNSNCVKSEAVDVNAKVEEKEVVPLGSAQDSEEESHQTDRDDGEVGERQNVMEKCLESVNSSPESRSSEDPSVFIPRTPTRGSMEALSQDALYSNDATPIRAQKPNNVQLTPIISNTSDMLEPALSGDEVTVSKPNSNQGANGIPPPCRRISDDGDCDRAKERKQSILWLGDDEASKGGQTEIRPSNSESTDLARSINSLGGVPDIDESSQTQESSSSLYLPSSLKPTTTDESIRNDSLDAVPLYHVDSGLASLRTDLSSHVSYFSYEDVSLASDELDTCAICLCPYEEGDVRIFSKRCQHAFHKDCILEWLVKSHNECPCCRTEMATKEEIRGTSASLLGTERLAQAMSVVNTSDGMQVSPPFSRVSSPREIIARARRVQQRAQQRAYLRSRTGSVDSGNDSSGNSANALPQTPNSHWLWSARFNDGQPSPGAHAASTRIGMSTYRSSVDVSGPVLARLQPTSPSNTENDTNTNNQEDWLRASRINNQESIAEMPAINPTRSLDAILQRVESTQEPHLPSRASDAHSNTAGLLSSGTLHSHWQRRNTSPSRRGRFNLTPSRRTHTHWGNRNRPSMDHGDEPLPVTVLPELSP